MNQQLTSQQQHKLAIQEALNTGRITGRLSLTNIGPVGATLISTALKSNEPFLHLTLRISHIGPYGGEQIGQALKSNNILQELNLKDNRLGPLGTIALCRALESNNTLKTLVLTLNKIGREGTIAIAGALKFNNTLRTLNLDNNGLISDDAIVIAEALKVNNSLTALSFNINNIGDEGAVAIGRALESNHTLQILNLWSNNIGNVGAIALGQALQSNKIIQQLGLSSNSIGPDGAIAIGEALESNNTLRLLNFYNNNIGNEGAEAVIVAIARNINNSSLSNLNLTNNNITRLPAQLAQCSRIILREFRYSMNPIDHIPPNVLRWLNPYQQQQNVNIHKDNQNVHNQKIQQCVKDSYNRIINACNGPSMYKSFDEVQDLIVQDPILSEQCKIQLIEYASNNDSHGCFNLTFAEALQYVFKRIEINEYKDGIKETLNKLMDDALCKCFTGRISRLIDCLNRSDDLVHIHIATVADIFRFVGERLIKNDNYSTESHRITFENELKIYGYELTEELRVELEGYYSVLDSFYEIYGPDEKL